MEDVINKCMLCNVFLPCDIFGHSIKRALLLLQIMERKDIDQRFFFHFCKPFPAIPIILVCFFELLFQVALAVTPHLWLIAVFAEVIGYEVLPYIIHGNNCKLRSALQQQREKQKYGQYSLQPQGLILI
jgi:hypothetical protein